MNMLEWIAWYELQKLEDAIAGAICMCIAMLFLLDN
jgi:hypothetical protein